MVRQYVEIVICSFHCFMARHLCNWNIIFDHKLRDEWTREDLLRLFQIIGGSLLVGHDGSHPTSITEAA